MLNFFFFFSFIRKFLVSWKNCFEKFFSKILIFLYLKNGGVFFLTGRDLKEVLLLLCAVGAQCCCCIWGKINSLEYLMNPQPSRKLYTCSLVHICPLFVLFEQSTEIRPHHNSAFSTWWPIVIFSRKFVHY